jgi:hypothetical protein
VAFYVPLGLRGLLLSIGTFLIGIWGALVYGWARRRRALSEAKPLPLTLPLPD